MSDSNLDQAAALFLAQTSPKPINKVSTLLETKSKSEVIRILTAEGYSRSAIVKAFKDAGVYMIYQFVRNVQTKPAKKTS